MPCDGEIWSASHCALQTRKERPNLRRKAKSKWQPVVKKNFEAWKKVKKGLRSEVGYTIGADPPIRKFEGKKNFSDFTPQVCNLDIISP